MVLIFFIDFCVFVLSLCQKLLFLLLQYQTAVQIKGPQIFATDQVLALFPALRALMADVSLKRAVDFNVSVTQDILASFAMRVSLIFFYFLFYVCYLNAIDELYMAQFAELLIVDEYLSCTIFICICYRHQRLC